MREQTRTAAGDIQVLAVQILAVQILAVQGMGEVRAGDDLAAALLHAIEGAGIGLVDGDVLVVSSKVVSKAEGLAVRAGSREALVERQSVRVVAERMTPRGPARIVQSLSGPVMAAAGVDASNVERGQVLALPQDPDASAAALRAALSAALRSDVRRAMSATIPQAQVGGPPTVAVVISDTAGRPWREGQTDIAIGCAGLSVVEDLRGGRDPYGNTLEVTVRAVADEIASAADLVKGKLAGVPAAIVRGLGHLVVAEDGPGAASMLRDAGNDWFRYGHVEAVQAALGAPPGSAAAASVPEQPIQPRTALERLERAALVTLAPLAWPGAWPPAAQDQIAVRAGDGPSEAIAEVVGADALQRGALVQRLLTACWAESLTAEVVGGASSQSDADVSGRTTVRVRL